MCIFTGANLRSVDSTRIFARCIDGQQVIAYQMSYKSYDRLAMILPIPTVPGTQAVQFINLEKYPLFFDDMMKAFPDPAFGKSRGRGISAPQNLPVEVVGSFEASFAPTSADLSRLDPLFRLSDQMLKAVGDRYPDYGFVIAKLRDGDVTIHPLAFRFPTRFPGCTLFFPTVHVHDETMPVEADFDHDLFCQSDMQSVLNWRISSFDAFQPHHNMVRARDFMQPEVEQYGMLDIDEPVRYLRVHGMKPNVDQIYG